MRISLRQIVKREAAPEIPLDFEIAEVDESDLDQLPDV